MDKAIVLLSAGLDSTANLYKAVKDYEVIKVLTVNYGQRAFKKENEYAKWHCGRLNLSHEVVSLEWLKEITNTSLVNLKMDIPEGTSISMDSFEQSTETAKAVWVPNRNGVFINIAGSYADSLGANTIIVGFNKEEAETFPDNSVEYIESVNKSLSYSTSVGAQVKCYTQHMVKTEIAELIQSLEVNWDKIWPCYFNGDQNNNQICKSCESCQRFLRAKESL